MRSSWFYDSFNDLSTQSQNSSSEPTTTTLARVNIRSLSANVIENLSDSFNRSTFHSPSSSKRRASARSASAAQPRKRTIDSLDVFVDERGSFDASSDRKPPAKRRSCASFIDSVVASVSEIVAPEEVEQLAVHPKKIEELKQWIRGRMAVEHGSKTLLLTGPCGAAKTASVRVVCAELGVEVVEFDGNFQEFELNHAGDEVWERSALRVFVQFMRSAQLSSIERMSLKHRLLLIEQLPVVFYRDIHLFHRTLREFVTMSRSLIVIVLSNIESCWELNPLRLFPTTIVDELAIEQIKFNAVAATFMTKAVRRIFNLLGVKSTENASAIREIVNAADGDIRKAMSILDCYFADRRFRSRGSCAPASFSPSRKCSPSRGGGGGLQPLRNSSSITGSLPAAVLSSPAGQVELFHFIGKLMYAKRAETVDECWRRCERALSRHCRAKYARSAPFKDNLNELIASCFVSGSFLAGYIFEHEPYFAPSLSALSNVAANLCEFDVALSSNVEANQLIDKYALDVAARSVVFHNYRPDYSSKSLYKTTYQFKKPKLKENIFKCDDIRQTAREAFSGVLTRASDSERLVLPMLSVMKFACTSKTQYDVLQKLHLGNEAAFKLSFQDTRLLSPSRAPRKTRGTMGGLQGRQMAVGQPPSGSESNEDNDEFSYIIDEVA